METTEGALLGGRVRYRQPARGHRTGLEPVLLAAAVPARPGDRVLEGGAGAGAGLLCLAARVPGVRGVGIERDGPTTALMRANFLANAVPFEAREADVSAAGPVGAVDHAFANPPWHAAEGTASPSPVRDLARRARPGLLRDWCRALAAPLRRRGTLTLILPGAGLPDALEALRDAGCGAPALLPLWPRAGRDAKLVLVRAVRGGTGPCRLRAGLVLHDGQGFTAEAEAVLRHAAAIEL